jgi:hypothetical protein
MSIREPAKQNTLQSVKMSNSSCHGVNLTLNYITHTMNDGQVPFLIVRGQIGK